MDYIFGFQFESSRDAENAIRGRDGYNFDGCRLRVLKSCINFWFIPMLDCGFFVVYICVCLSSIQVELAHGGSRGPPPSDRRGGYGGGSSR